MTEQQVTFVHVAESAVDAGGHVTGSATAAVRSFGPDAFRAAAAAVTADHPVCRAAVVLEPGRPLTWHVGSHAAAQVSYVDHWTGGGQDAESSGDRMAPFVLDRAPLVRFHACRTGETTARLELVAHPAAVDAATARALLGSLVNQCRGVDSGPPDSSDSTDKTEPFDQHESSELSEPPEKEPTQDLGAWTDTFSGFAPSPPHMWAAAVDWRRPEAAGSPAGTRLDIPPVLARALTDLAHACAADLADVLLAVHAKAVGAASGRTDVVVGIARPAAPRHAPAQVGARDTTTPARVILDDGTWASLVVRCRDARAATVPWLGYSHLRIARALGVEEFLDSTFSVAPGSGHPSVRVDVPFIGAVRCAVEPGPDSGISLTLTAGAGLREDQLEELIRLHFSALRHCVGGEPHSTMELVETYQLTTMLHEWNGERRSYHTRYCVHELVEQQCQRTPDAIAVLDAGHRLTYAELDAEADVLAERLRRSGAGVGAVVGICAHRSARLIVAFLAVLKAGAAYLPLEPRQPAERLGHLLRDSGAAIVLADSASRTMVPRGDWRVLPLDTDDPDPVADLALAADPTRPSPGDLMYVIYTSGSTGSPKGVEVPHSGIVNYLEWCREAYAARGEGGAALFSSVAFDMVVPNIYTPLIMGQRLCVLEDSLDLATVATQLAALAPFSFLKLTPGQLGILGEVLAPEQARALARTLVVGADAFPVRVLRNWRRLDGDTPILNEYGPTEASVGNSVYQAVGTEEGELLPIGRPIPNTTMYVLDERLAPLPVGVPGELYIGGACVVRGYANRADLTDSRFIPDPFSTVEAARMYRTGDVGRWLPGGDLEFLGRVDDQVKIRGHRVEPAEVEAALAAHPAVTEAVVTTAGATHERLALLGYYVSIDTDLSAESVRDFLLRRMPDYLVPSVLTPIDAVPLNANGKVDRGALPVPAADRAVTRRRRAAASTPVGQTLRRTWVDVFGREPESVDERLAGPDTPPERVVRLGLHLARRTGIAPRTTFRSISASDTFGELAEHLTSALPPNGAQA